MTLFHLLQYNKAMSTEVYISYTHGGEGEATAERVEAALRQGGFNPIRDKKYVKYRDDIVEFERRMGRSDIIVTIISDKYLKSVNCMSEMLFIKGHENMQQRVFPIVLEDATGIYDPQKRPKYLNYWQEEEDKLKTSLSKNGIVAGMETFNADLTRLAEIKLLIGKVTDLLRRMNAETAAHHQENNYADLLKAINQKLAETGADNPLPSEALNTGKGPDYIETPGTPDYFIGREVQLESLHKGLAEGEPLLLVNGMGGIGKTSLAQAYVNRPEYCSRYGLIAWVTVSNDIKTDMLDALATSFNLNLNQLNASENPFRLLVQAMRAKTGRNLLVLDNVNQEKPLVDCYRELAALRWTVLITSRCRPERYKLIEVEKLEPPDAEKLFLHHYGQDAIQSSDEKALEALLGKVEYHTLIVELLAKTGRKRGLTLQELEQCLDTTEGLGHKELERIISIGGHADIPGRKRQEKLYRYILSLFDFTSLPQQQCRILGNISLLPAERIPVKLLKELFETAKDDETGFEDIIDELIRTGWLTGSADKHGSLKMHSLIAEVARAKIQLEEGAYTALVDSLSEKLQEKVTQALPYFPYARTVVELYPYENRSLALLCCYLANAGKEAGRFGESVRLYERAGKLFEKLEDKVNTAVNLSKLGDIHQAMGDIPQALTFFQKETVLFEELYAENPRSEALKKGLAISYSQLGDIHQAMGDIPQALTFFQKYLELAKDLYTENPRSEDLKNGLAISYSRLGDIHKALGGIPQALTFFQKDLELTKELYAENPRSEGLKNGLAISYSKLGDIHQAMGDIPQALTFFQKVTVLFEELYAENPRSDDLKNGLAISYYNLGVIHKEMGYDGASDYLRQAQELWKALQKKNPLPKYAQYIEITTALLEEWKGNGK